MAGAEEIFDQRFSDEEDLISSEEEDADRMKSCKEKADAQGLVAFNDWEKAIKLEMKKHGHDDPDIIKAVQKASKATCLVRRAEGSDERKKYYEEQAKKCTDNRKRKKLGKKAKKWNKIGYGTGVLVSPRFPGQGWLVITNNHVIMNECEAKTAEVYFDYNEDVPAATSLKNVCMTFTVEELVSKSLRTENSGDIRTLDYSLLLLKPSNDDDDKFLEDHAIGFEESARVQATSNITDPSGGTRPLIMFSHPHQLAKRLSFGPFPNCIKEYPVQHIKHELGSLPGSSGGNLLFSSVDDKYFKYWNAAFLHYRHGHAVSWQAIGEHLRAIVAKKLSEQRS